MLNLFAYTAGFGAAAAAGGATCTVNVDNKGACLAAGRENYRLNGLAEQDDDRAFCTRDAVRFLKLAAKSKKPEDRFGLVVSDPPPAFGRQRGASAWEFTAERDFGRLLALCLAARLRPPLASSLKDCRAWLL